MEHKACEGAPCPKGAPSFRDLQCLSYDRHTSKKKGSMLTAIINDGEPHTHTHTFLLVAPLTDQLVSHNIKKEYMGCRQ